MRVQCQSCPADYIVSDSMVTGKVFKMRCHECSATIVIDGNEPSPEVDEGADAPAFDVSILGERPYTPVTEDRLDSRLQQISESWRSFVVAEPEGPRPNGLVVCIAPDGSLRHIGWYQGNRAIEQLNLDVPAKLAMWQTGSAGEVYRKGTVEVLGPWSDNDGGERTNESYSSWVKRRVASVLEHGSREARKG